MSPITNYYPNDDEINKLLYEAVIVFDASALLELYHYTSKTQKSIIDDIFAHLKNRLWLPHQVMAEYLKNRENVAAKPTQSYIGLIQTFPVIKKVEI